MTDPQSPRAKKVFHFTLINSSACVLCRQIVFVSLSCHFDFKFAFEGLVALRVSEALRRKLEVPMMSYIATCFPYTPLYMNQPRVVSSQLEQARESLPILKFTQIHSIVYLPVGKSVEPLTVAQ
jgi:hypothetical protein